MMNMLYDEYGNNDNRNEEDHSENGDDDNDDNISHLNKRSSSIRTKIQHRINIHFPSH
jgi:hypothetical protein